MISKLCLIPSAACLFALAISPALFGASPAKLPWNDQSHLNPDRLKVHYVRSALRKLDFEVTEADRASHDKQVVSDVPSGSAIEANIVRVGPAANPAANPIASHCLGCQVEYNSEIPESEEDSTHKVYVGMIYTPTNGGESGKMVGGATIHRYQGQPLKSTTQHGTGLSKPGRYNVTAVVLGQEFKGGPWYLLDSYHDVIKIE